MLNTLFTLRNCKLFCKGFYVGYLTSFVEDFMSYISQDRSTQKSADYMTDTNIGEEAKFPTII